MTNVRRIAVVLGGVMSVAFVVGCDQSNEAAQAQQTPAPAQAESSGRVSETPNSSLGGAKRAAENTATKIEQHQRDLEKQIDEK